jgi:hypothetical protein
MATLVGSAPLAFSAVRRDAWLSFDRCTAATTDHGGHEERRALWVGTCCPRTAALRIGGPARAAWQFDDRFEISRGYDMQPWDVDRRTWGLGFILFSTLRVAGCQTCPPLYGRSHPRHPATSRSPSATTAVARSRSAESHDRLPLRDSLRVCERTAPRCDQDAVGLAQCES